MLRKALGDSVKEHRYIVTVPKQGYCFVADVRELAEDDTSSQVLRPARELLGRRYSENTEAHQLCLKGRHFWARRTAGAVELAEAPGTDVACSPYVRSRLYAEIGDEGPALRWLDKAYAERDGGLSLLKVDPGLDSLRAEPRFTAVLERIGLS